MKKYSMATEAILVAIKGFEFFGSSDKPGHVALTAAMISSEIEPIGKAYEGVVKSFYEKWGLKRTVGDDGGEEFVPAKDEKTGKDMPGSRQIAPQHIEEFKAEIAKMDAVKVEFNAPELSSEDIKKITVAPNVLKAILPFIGSTK